MAHSNQTAMTIGELVIDWIATSKGDGFIEANTYMKSLGGNAANVAIGLSRLGTEASIVAKVGDDIQGKYLLKVLKDENVYTNRVIVSDKNPTAQCYVFTSNDDDNTFLNWPPNNAAQKLHPDEINDDTINDVGFIHATGISLTSEPRRSAILKTLELAKKRRIAISFDAGFPTGEGEEAKRSVKKILKLADVIKLNVVELIYWNKQIDPTNKEITEKMTSLYENPPSSGFESHSNSDTCEIDSDLLISLASKIYNTYSPYILTVTMASKGSFIFTKEGGLSIPAYSVDTVAGVGAGDAYVAGFIHKILKDSKERSALDYLSTISREQVKQAGKFASSTGALATRSLSAHESLPNLSEVENLIS